MIMGMMLLSVAVFSQNARPKLEVFGRLIKATYFHENGKIQQQGFFKNGKLEGQWVSYDINGNKIAIAEYSRGLKTGKWVFLNNDMLREVNYANNIITSVKNWKQDALVVN